MKTVKKGYMGFAQGMVVGQARSQGKKGFRQVDWAAVKQFIEDNKDKLERVAVGLAEDWGYTSGEVWNSEEGYIPKEATYVYGASKWATPAISVNYKDGEDDTIEMWMYVSDEDADADAYFDVEEEGK